MGYREQLVYCFSLIKKLATIVENMERGSVFRCFWPPMDGHCVYMLCGMDSSCAYSIPLDISSQVPLIVSLCGIVFKLCLAFFPSSTFSILFRPFRLFAMHFVALLQTHTHTHTHTHKTHLSMHAAPTIHSLHTCEMGFAPAFE